MKAKWTTEAPTVEGWYWAYEDYGGSFTIEVVQIVIHAYLHPFVLSSEHNGQQSLEHWDAWLGPIKVPSPPPENLDDIRDRSRTK